MDSDKVLSAAQQLGCEIPSGPEGREFFFYPDELLKFAAEVVALEQASHPDCNQCANRGKTYAMSQESSCDHCVWQESSWRKNLFLKKEG